MITKRFLKNTFHMRLFL